MNRIEVVVADDHAVLRDGLRMAIHTQADLVVVGEAGTGPEAVDRVRETEPRVLCLDLSMPGWGSTTTIEKVREVSARTRVLVFTMHDDPAYARTALAAGADGFLLKTNPTAVLLNAIRTVAAGKSVIDPILRPALDEVPDHPLQGVAGLSRREREVLDLLVRGHTHQEIADRLFVSVKTVETYRARVREKTGLKTRADFVCYGVDAGLLATKDPSGTVKAAEGRLTPSDV
ncbi:response regulator [Limnoglobus roseus]|uniref:DNA-binding response regulator n=1 Tax=Limnoglobus roseus TaxID=2598579 RepID=A0A5C1ANN0_9BACT|nr:response regulator transcription factor [Limnoglobus roseus]QEL21009.1 DNA-binding response regulator [Limnoglobus roseus]